MRALLGSCAILMLSFLLLLIGYVSFRGFLIRKDISSAVLPDYQNEFFWPGEREPLRLWLSPTVPLGKMRADQLHNILTGKTKNWVKLAESGERLTLLLSQKQLESLKQNYEEARMNWRMNRNIKVYPNTQEVAQALLRTPGSLAILPSIWGQANWEQTQSQNFLPRNISFATRSLLLNSKLVKELEQIGKLEIKEQRETEYHMFFRDAKELLPKAHTAPYNWLLGQTDIPGYHPIQLQYREYEILKLSFLLKPPAKNGKIGGIATILFSSIILILTSLFWAVPLGLAVAIFLTEYTQLHSKNTLQACFVSIVTLAVQTLSGIPSIIFGLFGSIFFVPIFGIGLLSGAATLVLMLLPTIILTAKEALLTVAPSYIEASLGLGAQKWYTVLHISLPAALPGILAGVILAIGRALGETAALIYTLGTGYQATLSRFPQLLNDWPQLWQEFWLSPSLAKLAQVAQDYPLLDLHSSLRSISLHLYWMTINGISLQKGFSTAFILIFLIVLLNMATRIILSRFSNKQQAIY